KRISSAMPSSNWRRRRRVWKAEKRCPTTSHLLRRGVQRRRDRGRQAVPVGGLLAQPPASGGGEGVELRLAIVLALPPLGGDQLLVLQPVERRIERALRNLQRLARDLADAQQHAVPMQRRQGYGLEDQHIERARKQVCGLGHVFVS